MTRKLLTLFILPLICLGSSCGGSNGWKNLSYDVAEDATLNQVVTDLSALTGTSFTVDADLQTILDEETVDLPTLKGLNVEEVLTLIEDTMPPEAAFIYEELSDESVLLRLRFQQAEDVSAADPLTVLGFDAFTATALYSNPLFDEECGGSEESLVDLFVEVSSDPAGHSEFIGDFPSSVEVLTDGETIAITGDSPWVTINGDLTEDGSFTGTGSGVVAGYPDVTVTFDGQSTSDGISGTLTMGVGGELPGGQPIVYSVNPD